MAGCNCHCPSPVQSVTPTRFCSGAARVWVTDKKTHKPVMLFADANLTIPMTNPFVTDSNGNYNFFAEAHEYTVCAEVLDAKAGDPAGCTDLNVATGPVAYLGNVVRPCS